MSEIEKAIREAFQAQTGPMPNKNVVSGLYAIAEGLNRLAAAVQVSNEQQVALTAGTVRCPGCGEDVHHGMAHACGGG